MYFYTYSDRDDLTDIRRSDHLSRLLRLIDDLECLKRGILPDPKMLERAPIIDHWTATTVPFPCLMGNVWGRPGIDSGLTTYSSPIVVSGQDYGWIRTASRYYRLGQPGPYGPTRISR